MSDYFEVSRALLSLVIVDNNDDLQVLRDSKKFNNKLRISKLTKFLIVLTSYYLGLQVLLFYEDVKSLSNSFIFDASMILLFSVFLFSFYYTYKDIKGKTSYIDEHLKPFYNVMSHNKLSQEALLMMERLKYIRKSYNFEPLALVFFSISSLIFGLINSYFYEISISSQFLFYISIIVVMLVKYDQVIRAYHSATNEIVTIHLDSSSFLGLSEYNVLKRAFEMINDKELGIIYVGTYSFYVYDKNSKKYLEVYVNYNDRMSMIFDLEQSISRVVFEPDNKVKSSKNLPNT